MEEASSVGIILLLSLVPAVSGLAVLFLLYFRFSPMLFFPAVAIASVALLTYFKLLKDYYVEGKLRKMLTLALALSAILIMCFAVFAAVMPNWTFKARPDKTICKYGEVVMITVALTNEAYIGYDLKAQETDYSAVMFAVSIRHAHTNLEMETYTWRLIRTEVHVPAKKSIWVSFYWWTNSRGSEAEVVGEYTVVATAVFQELFGDGVRNITDSVSIGVVSSQ